MAVLELVRSFLTIVPFCAHDPRLSTPTAVSNLSRPSAKNRRNIPGLPALAPSNHCTSEESGEGGRELNDTVREEHIGELSLIHI